MDAVDHQHIRKDTAVYLEAIRRVYPDAEVYHVAVHEFQNEQTKNADSFAILSGELCRPTKAKTSYNHVITNTLSSRYYLKQYNDRNQTKIEKTVAPLYALKQTDMATGYLDLAIKYMLQNHPHDSICGCSIDQVHRDMIYRFDQTKQLCHEITWDFEKKLSALPESSGEKVDGSCLRIFNPLPYRTKKTVKVKASMAKLPTYAEPFACYGDDIPAFKLLNHNGNEITYGFVSYCKKNVFEIAFEAELTPMGITEFFLKPSNMPTRQPSRILTSATSAKGDFASISINSNGTVDLCDLESGEVYKNLLTLIDNCDLGDGWYTCAPLFDTFVTPNEAELSVIENSAVRATFRIVQKMKLPLEATVGKMRHRSEKTVDFRVTHDVTLSKGDKGITVHTHLENNAYDHRLMLRLPSVVEGDTYEASQAFGYVTRACGDDPSTAEWKEYGWAQRNMAGICAKRNGKRGLAFISEAGLHECGVWQNGDMDITLFRAVGRTPNGEREPEGQLLRPLDFTYKIVPYTNATTFAELQREQDILATELICATANGVAPMKRPSLMSIEGENIVYSTAEMLPDGTPSVRVFNDGSKRDVCTLTLPDFTKSASLVELDGRHIRDLEIKDGKVEFELPPFRIATVKIS
jgi:alpha-mannosidase/mannosylglycerate hydrolase